MSASHALQLTQHQVKPGVILSQVLNVCPPGTKLMALNLGSLMCDTGWLVRGANGSLKSNPSGPSQPDRRELAVYALLIDHPDEGLILMDTGCGRNIVETWGPVADVFAPEQEGEEYELDTAIKNLGYDIKDVKKVIMGHLHLDREYMAASESRGIPRRHLKCDGREAMLRLTQLSPLPLTSPLCRCRWSHLLCWHRYGDLGA